jgi:hypothetical protein
MRAKSLGIEIGASQEIPVLNHSSPLVEKTPAQVKGPELEQDRKLHTGLREGAIIPPLEG